MYAEVRWILIGYLLGLCKGWVDTNWIFIFCRGRWILTGYWGVRWRITEYLLHVRRSQAVSDRIFIHMCAGVGY